MSFRSFSTELKAFAAVWKSLATALAESPAQPGRLHLDGNASSAVRLAAHR